MVYNTFRRSIFKGIYYLYYINGSYTRVKGGLLAASLLKVSIYRAIPICIIGNIIPIPFILLFIKKIFKWLKRTKIFYRIIDKIEKEQWKKVIR